MSYQQKLVGGAIILAHPVWLPVLSSWENCQNHAHAYNTYSSLKLYFLHFIVQFLVILHSFSYTRVVFNISCLVHRRWMDSAVNNIVNCMWTRSSADADKLPDAFRGQSRSPIMVPFDILGMVSY